MFCWVIVGVKMLLTELLWERNARKLGWCHQ